MDIPNRQQEMVDTFWNFLAYLQKYIEAVKDLIPVDTDPARTLLLSALTEHMRPVLLADLAFVGYCSLENDSSECVQIVKESIRPAQGPHWQSSLIKRLEELAWRLPSDGLAVVRTSSPVMLFDQGRNYVTVGC